MPLRLFFRTTDDAIRFTCASVIGYLVFYGFH